MRKLEGTQPIAIIAVATPLKPKEHRPPTRSYGKLSAEASRSRAMCLPSSLRWRQSQYLQVAQSSILERQVRNEPWINSLGSWKPLQSYEAWLGKYLSSLPPQNRPYPTTQCQLYSPIKQNSKRPVLLSPLPSRPGWGIPMWEDRTGLRIRLIQVAMLTPRKLNSLEGQTKWLSIRSPATYTWMVPMAGSRRTIPKKPDSASPATEQS